MKYLIDGRLLSNKKNGIHRYTEELIISYQKNYGIENISVVINKSLMDKPINHITCKLSPFNIIHFFLFYFFLKKQNFDVLHSCFYSNSFFKLKDKKYITTVHDMMYAVLPNFFSKNNLVNTLKREYFNFIVSKSLKNSDLIISVSETTKLDVHKFGYKSILIREGLNLKNIYSKMVNGILPNSYFLYSGNFRAQKNLIWMLNAFKEAKSPYKLIMCGNGVGENLDAYFSENIINIGYVSDQELQWLYQNAKAFIYPSFYEGFGLPVLEALNNKCKVICSDGGALAEFDKNTILQFNLGNREQLINYIQNINNYAFNTLAVNNMLNDYAWDKNLLIMHQKINALLV